MRPEPSDHDEETRVRGIAEQCWLGPLCLLFWVLIILGYIHGCARGAECKLAWDANAVAEQVTKYLVRVEDFTGEFIVATETTTNSITIPFVPRGVVLTISVVAINAKGPSLPAIITHRYPLMVRVTDQRSADLKTWTDYHVKEFAAETKGFYRQKIEQVP